MLEIKFKVPQEKKNEIGEMLCRSLVGEKAFVDNDIIVNYTDYEDIYVVLGKNNSKDKEVEVHFDNLDFLKMV